jgi:hypothetical protein
LLILTKLFSDWRQNEATSHVCVAAHRMCGVATDPATTDGPVANFRVHVLAALALAGSVSAASTQDAALGEKVFAKCRSAWSN